MDAVDTVKLAMTKAWASGFTTEVEQMLIDNLPEVLSLARSNGWQDVDALAELDCMIYDFGGSVRSMGDAIAFRKRLLDRLRGSEDV